MLEFRSLGGDSVSNLGPQFRSLRVAAAMLFAMLAAGCAPPLAWQHPYFAAPRESAARIEAETRHSLTYHHALQLTRRACAGSESVAGASDEPDFGTAPARRALADSCVVSPPRSVTWPGGTSTAFRRWVEDRVLELPDPGETASSAGGS